MVSLTADTNIAPGTGVSVNSAGNAVQSWGPAPNVAGIVYPFPTTRFDGSEPNAHPSILMMGSGSFVAFAQSAGVIAGTISGSTITLGSVNTDASLEATGNTSDGPPSRPLAASLSSALFVNAFISSGALKCTAVSLSGTTLTVGTPVQVSAQSLANPNYASIAKLDATHFVLAYTLADNTSHAVVGSVSGTSVTLGSPVQLSATGTACPIVALALSSSTAVFLYNDSTNNFAVAGSISGTTISLGTAVQPDATLSSVYGYGCVLDSTHFVVGNNTGVPDSALQVGSVSGTTITFGGAVTVIMPPFLVNNGYVQALSSSAFIIFPAGLNAPVICSVSGTTITVGSMLPLLDIPQYGNAAGAVYANVAILSATSFIFTDAIGSVYQYSNGALSGPIRHRVLNPGYWVYAVDSTRVLATLVSHDLQFGIRVLAAAADISDGPIGFTEAGATIGNPVEIKTSGVCGGFAGLVAGTMYYVNGDGTVTSHNLARRAGMAISSTQLVIANNNV